MKTLLLVLAMLITAPPSIYTFKVQNIDGKTLDLKKYKGKKVLIVNTAIKMWLYQAIC
jgi:glutathione peroxidase